MDVKVFPTVCLCTVIISRDTLGLCRYQAACTEIGKSESVLVDRNIRLALAQDIPGFDVLMDPNSSLAAAIPHCGRCL